MDDTVLARQPQESSEALQWPLKPVRRNSKWDVVLEFVRTRLDGSINPAFNTTKDVAAMFTTGPDEVGVAIQTSQLRGGVSNVRNSAAPLTQDDMTELYSVCVAAQKRLEDTITKFRLGDGKSAISIDMTKTHRLDQVHDALKQASDVVVEAGQAYADATSKDFWGRIRDGFRKFSEKSGNAKCFVELIPQADSYLSVLTGGLKLICTAASRLGKVRVIITEALEDIPTILNDQGFIAEALDGRMCSKVLHERNAALSAAVLNAVEAIIIWFREHPTKKTLRSLGSPDTAYENRVVKQIEVVRKRAEDFKSYANISMQTLSLQNHDQISSLMKEMHRDGNNRINYLHAEFNAHTQRTNMQFASQNEQLHTVLSLCELLYQDLYVKRQEQSIFPQRPVKAALEGQQHDTPLLLPEDLITEYAYDPYLVGEDCERLLGLQHTLRIADQDRAVALMQDPAFVAWLSLHESSALLIHGNSKATPKSATSFVCAKLVESLFIKASTRESNTIPLAFFCGEHTNERTDDYAHPPGLALSLLLQLIDKMAAHMPIDPAPLQNAIRDLDAENGVTILNLFVRIVAQLPSEAMLFIIIDGVGFFEDSNRREEMKCLARKLARLVKKKHHPVVKLLMATPAATIAVSAQFRSNDAQVLDMRRSYPGRNGFKALGWLTAEQRLAEIGDMEEVESY